MQVLHILKSKPEQLISDLTSEICRDQECRNIELYQDNVDWDGLLQEIFSADKVICWW